jgi:alpha-D-ribose 1-methylphosphonate 5-triphosphate synthase subunit PhnH
VIVQLAALGQGTRYRLAGPGLREPVMLSAIGLPSDFPAIWQRNHALFPRGVDIVLCADTTLTALPRSVTIEEA